MLSPLYGQLSPLRVPTSMRFISNDADVVAYVLAVEAADGQRLEDGVISAYESFIVGCKSDGIWSAIKASCILAGARTLSGALVPLVGTAPINANFVSGDYNRETGLLGNGSTKYLDSNRSNSSDGQNNKHISVFPTSIGSQARIQLSANYQLTGESSLGYASNFAYATIHNQNWLNTNLSTGSANNKLFAAKRASSGSFQVICGGVMALFNDTSQVPSSDNILIYRRAGTTSNASNARLAFYSIGESLDLAALDARVSTLMTALSAAIP
jgi:hypothetical protein